MTYIYPECVHYVIIVGYKNKTNYDSFQEIFLKTLAWKNKSLLMYFKWFPHLLVDWFSNSIKRFSSCKYYKIYCKL